MNSVDDEAIEIAMLKTIEGNEAEGDEYDPEAEDLEREELGELSPEEAEIIRMIRGMKSQSML
jgi:hypothetical protein